MHHLVKALQRVTSSLEDWNDGRWVHFSEAPFVKINPNQFHRDPAGIYLFPEKFVTAGGWESYKYKFICEIPNDLNVLDFAKLSRREMVELAKSVLAFAGMELHDDDKDEILNGKYYLSHGWESIWNTKYMTQQAKFNKALRSLGYDAVFDDTKSIHSSEIQMIILDPRNVKVIERIEASGSGYEETVEVMEYIEKLAKKANIEVEIKKPKQTKGDWGGEKSLQGFMHLGDDDNYLDLVIEPIFPKGRKVGPKHIDVSKRYSKPDVGMGAGAIFKLKDRSFADIDKNISNLFEKIFQT